MIAEVKGSRSIRALSEVPRSAVEDYLRSKGHAPAVIAWKYYDPAFNAGRERGLAWVQGDVVRGFIGVIPFAIAADGARRDAVWTCDWSLASPAAAAGMGIMLLQRAIDRWGTVYGFGGNENTRSLLPRIAQYVDEDAAVTLMRPLRLGYWLERARRRYANAPSTPMLDRLRVPIPLPGRSGGARVVEGVSQEIGPLLDAAAEPGNPGAVHRPAYDLAHVAWLLGRCPATDVWTVLPPVDAPVPRAAALLWRLASGTKAEWRVAFWHLPGAEGAVRNVLDAASLHAARLGGSWVAAIAGSRDRQRRGALVSAGYRERRGRNPLYVSTKATLPIHTASVDGLSYLDTDSAYLP